MLRGGRTFQSWRCDLAKADAIDDSRAGGQVPSAVFRCCTH